MRTLKEDRVEVFSDAAELARVAAERFASLAERAINQSGRFTVALSGGSTPKAMLAELAGPEFAARLPWSSIFFFWGDERCVPPDHADSNYRMAREALLAKVPVPEANIFRIPAEDDDHERAAQNYSTTMQNFFGLAAGEWPQFDLVFLGMGADGHTASLFPGTTALAINDRIAAANYVEKLQAQRITLTAATINHARQIIFLIAGADKAAALREVIEGARNPSLYPSQMIEPTNGNLLWMIDEAAAAQLATS